MNDIVHLLENIPSAEPASGELVASDLDRARHARRRLRVTRATMTSGLAAIVVTGVAIATMTGGGPRAPQAQGGAQPGNVTAPAANGPVALVAYHGQQPAGFTVAKVPTGWRISDSRPSDFVLAPPGVRGSGSEFVNKLAVSLQSVDDPSEHTGTPVTVGGHPGTITTSQDGVRTLWFSDGPHLIWVQAWSNLHWSNAELIAFAEGITVLPGAVAPRG